MSFVSLYRKWRSQSFDEIVGQIHVTQTLKNAIEHDRIAHAYLFCGPRGTGKTSTARILAKSLNCERGPTPNPCNKCDTCNQISQGSALDVIEIDAASNRGINEIRELREKVKYAPTRGRYKVYIVDEVHMLTKEAFNALLKTLEEPPKHVIFVLATTEPYKILSTILSRCQRFDFKRISINDTMKHLREISKKEDLNISDSALNLIASTSEGSLRDALSILDQLISFSGRNIKLDDVVIVMGSVSEQVLLKLADCVVNQDTPRILTLTRKLVEEGKDINQLIKEFIKYLRDLLVVKICPDHKELVDRTPATIRELERQAKNITLTRLMNIIKILTDLKEQLTRDSQWHIQMEIACLRICQRSIDKSPDVMEERLTELEEKIKKLSLIPDKSVVIRGKPSEDSVTKIETVDIIESKKLSPMPEIDKTKEVISEERVPEEVVPEKVVPDVKETIRISENREKDDDFSEAMEQIAEEYNMYVPADEEIFMETIEEEVYNPPPPLTEEKKGEELNFELIKNRWEDFLYRFKGENLPIYQVLIAGEVTEFNGKMLTLSFPKKFYISQMEEYYKINIENVLERFFGNKISIKGKLIEKHAQEMSLFEDNSQGTMKNKKIKDSDRESPTIDDATKLFGGEVII
ncbi:MAG TPA: DNA polymerase III subunit gamma/tau [Candidatus Eremiobacteraeota bacterium]|nr:DNA polymerase III subunit gamma/tau [Candidatus Eremiobacteraeota bacterium]